MLTTYKVSIWNITVYKGRKTTTYYVRWIVDGNEFKEPFKHIKLAESFRSSLLAAARRGEAFYVVSGLPVSMQRADNRMSWFSFACQYMDAKWPKVAATTRRTIAEALTAITATMLTTDRGQPDGELLRASLKRWAFNSVRRKDPHCPTAVTNALDWVGTHTHPVASLSDAKVLRRVLDGLTMRLDGTRRASSVVMRWRKILNNAVEYAIEQKLLAVNPIPALKWTAPRASQAIDRRSVVNPLQARALLEAVRSLKPSGPRLVALYACLYFAGLRPEEAAGLTKANLSLPTTGWGELHLEKARPYAGRDWTDDGEARDDRHLKQRAPGEIRPVPCAPELTAILHEHMERFGTTPDGRLFVGERNHDSLPSLTITRVWARARQEAFTAEVVASPLASTPYDLRHAAVSTWLNAGVPATQVAEWAGHSVEVLLKIYAKCLDGEDARLRSRVEDALGRPRP